MKIKVFISEQQLLQEIEGAATTWGELKTLLQNKGISTDSVKATVKETGTSFESDIAELPTNLARDVNNNPNGFDFTLFLNPIKTKSGL